MKEYDSSGRQKLATDWDAIANIPDRVLELAAAAAPGSGDWVVQYDGDTNTFFFTSSSVFSIDAADVTYTSTGSQWTATDVQVALHDLEAAVDVLQDTVGGVVTETTGNFLTGLSGFGSTPTGTLYWIKIGSWVRVYAQADITGTSNSNAFALNAAIPAGIRPAHKKIVPAAGFEDSGSPVPSWAQIATDGTVTFLRTYYNGSATITDAVWTNSGTKGILQGGGFAYDLD